jgi:Flp pilus assembly pilin Flp
LSALGRGALADRTRLDYVIWSTTVADPLCREYGFSRDPTKRTMPVSSSRPRNSGTDIVRRSFVVRLYPFARGQGLAEYALILSLIAVIAIAALFFLGGNISKILSTIGKTL